MRICTTTFYDIMRVSVNECISSFTFVLSPFWSETNIVYDHNNLKLFLKKLTEMSVHVILRDKIHLLTL